MRIGLFIIAFMLFGLTSIWSQATLQDQYLFASNEDSIQVKDFLYDQGNYLVWLVGEDDQSQQVVDTYSSEVLELELDYGVHLVFLSEHTPSQDIYEVLKSSELSNNNHLQLTQFDALYSGSPELFLINHRQEIVYQVSGMVSTSSLKQLIKQYLVLDYLPILADFFIECLGDNRTCDTTEYLTYAKRQVSKDNHLYKALKQQSNTYLVREDVEEEIVYLYEEQLDTSIVLYTFDYQVCDTVALYSVLTESFHNVIITDKYDLGGRTYWETDLPSFCVDEYLSIISGVGTSAGLLPLFDQSYYYSTLYCQYQDGLINYATEGCDPDKPDNGALTLFPNPATDQITLQGLFSEISIDALFDMSGRPVNFLLLDETTISTQDLPAGVYITRAIVDGVDTYYQFVKI